MNYRNGYAVCLRTAFVLCFFVVMVNAQGANSDQSMCIQLVAREDIVRNDGSFVVRVRLNNTFDKPIPLKHLPRFTVEAVEMDDMNVSNHRKKLYAFGKFKKESTFISTSRLLPGESLEFEIDLFDLEWNLEGSSILSNSRLSKSLKSGKYRLQADLVIGADQQNQVPRFGRIESNVVEFVYVNGSEPILEQ